MSSSRRLHVVATFQHSYTRYCACHKKLSAYSDSASSWWTFAPSFTEFHRVGGKLWPLNWFHLMCGVMFVMCYSFGAFLVWVVGMFRHVWLFPPQNDLLIMYSLSCVVCHMYLSIFPTLLCLEVQGIPSSLCFKSIKDLFGLVQSSFYWNGGVICSIYWCYDGPPTFHRTWDVLVSNWLYVVPSMDHGVWSCATCSNLLNMKGNMYAHK